MPIITGPILDSSGAAASGILRVRASRPFDIGTGHVTQALAVAEVRGGEPLVNGQAWSVPVTPEGVFLILEQDLDGEATHQFSVIVPAVERMTYSQLLFNRGLGVGGANAYWWDLTGGQEFPPAAVDGDLGFDSVTGDVWRFEA